MELRVDDRQLERYSRHILIPGIDIAGQQRLLNSTVLLVGVGGLGSPVAMYLAASGIGHIILNDHDHVDLGNLQRQIIHTTPDINRSKVESARDKLHALNPDIRISTIGCQLITPELAQQVRRADAVIDASDNFTTRYTLNSACVTAQTPLVWGAAIGFEGQATTFCNSNEDDTPCLNCLYPYHSDQGTTETCGDSGVFAPVTGIIGSIMAAETLKLLLGLGKSLSGRLLQINSATLEWRQSQLNKDPSCPTCNTPRRVFNHASHASE
jgi:molybdopterin-synthase adenylyltransferase